MNKQKGTGLNFNSALALSTEWCSRKMKRLKLWMALDASCCFNVLQEENPEKGNGCDEKLNIFTINSTTFQVFFCQFMKFFFHISQRFAAVIMRIREPRTTALIFSSGKMVCTGAKRSEVIEI